MASERAFEPPKSVGEPFRADPSDAAPFLTENDKVPVVPVESAPYVEPDAPQFAHPPSHSPEYGGASSSGQPVFRTPGQSGSRPGAPLTPNQRFARTAMWLGVASIFVFNLILGPISFFMGLTAYRRGEKENGRLAMIFGAVGTAFGVAILVLVATGALDVDELLRRIREPN